MTNRIIKQKAESGKQKATTILRSLMLVAMIVCGVGESWGAYTYNGVTYTPVAGSKSGSEGYTYACDGSTSSKMCVTSFSSAYVIIQASEAVYLTGYNIITANDNASYNGRNPQSWTIEGCDSQNGTHETIVTVTNDDVLQDVNYTTYSFTCSATKAYKYFKFTVTAVESGNTMQFSEFNPLGVTSLSNPTSITATPISVGVGESSSIPYTLTPSTACYNNVTYTSSNTSIATVDNTTGTVTGVAVGTATITLTAHNQDGTTACTTTAEVEVVNVTTETGIGYVITYQNAHFLGGTSSTDITTFNPYTCLWTGSNGSVWTNNSGGHLNMGSQLINTNSNRTMTLYGSESGTTGQHIYGNSNYLYYNNGWTRNQSNYTNCVFSVTRKTYPEESTVPTISGDDTFESTGNKTYSVGTAAVYKQSYYDYIFYDGAHHYCLTASSNATTTAPDYETFTYTWSLSNAGDDHVTIDSSTGAISYSTLYSTDTQGTLTLTAKSTNKTYTITKTITFKSKLPTTLTFAETVPAVSSDGWSVKAPTATLTASNGDDMSSKTVSYTYNGCTVDNNGWLKTNDGVTTATITANFAGDDTYAASTATYTITTISHNALNESTIDPIAITPSSETLDLGGTQTYSIPASVTGVTRTCEQYTEYSCSTGESTIGSFYKYLNSEWKYTLTAPTVDEVSGATINLTQVNWSYTDGFYTYAQPSSTNNQVVITRNEAKTAETKTYTITATATYGGSTQMSATATITIPLTEVDITAFYLSTSDITLAVEETAQISYSYQPNYDSAGKTYVNVTYSGYDTDLISVDENGLITGKAEGTTKVTLTTKKLDGTTGFTATVNVTVQAPTGVYLDFTNGNDNNDGLTASTAKKTWKGAYQLLRYGPNAKRLRDQWDAHSLKYNNANLSDTNVPNNSGTNVKFSTVTDFTGSIYNNIIYLVGDVSDANRNALLYTNVSTSTSDPWKTYTTCMYNILSTGLMKPATISGKYATKGTTSGTSTITLNSSYWYTMTLNEDTRFEDVTFKGGGSDFEVFCCAYYDLEMGKNVQMSNIKSSTASVNTGVVANISTPHFQIFGGYNDDRRFRVGSISGGVSNFDYYLPHPEGFDITIKSGYYSTICAGGRQCTTDGNAIMGSPNAPIKCKITIDIDRVYNDAHNQPINATSKYADYDVGAVLAGNHECAMYGDVDIVIKSGRVARVMNGTLGAPRDISWTEGGQSSATKFPYDSFFGRANTLIDPREPSDEEKAITSLKVGSTTYTKGTNWNGYATKDDMVRITELYGGGLGRHNESNSLQVSTYFYGKSTVTINGGVFDISDIAINSALKSKTDCVTGIFASGAGGVSGVNSNDDVTIDGTSINTGDDRLPHWSDTNKTHVVYNSTKTDLVTVKCYNTSTSDYTDIALDKTSTTIAIHGGKFGTADSPMDGVYGGGFGYTNTACVPYTNSQKTPNVKAGCSFGEKGETVSTITIDGGEIYGDIYGAGRGSDTYYNASSVGNLTGNSYKYLGIITGNVILNIGGDAKIHGSIYGAGRGIANTALADMARIVGDCTLNISGNAIITGDIYGGGQNGSVTGNTYLNVSGSPTIGTGATGNIFGAGLGSTTSGASSSADVSETTNVTITSLGYADPTQLHYVYGGGNLSSQVGTKANVTVKTGAAGDGTFSVFGGGLGAATNCAETLVTIQATGDSDNSVVDVYGGGQEGPVGTEDSKSATTVLVESGKVSGSVFGGGNLANVTGTTTVNVDGGTVSTAVYGGGALANTGNTTVNLNAGTVNDVYGGGLGSTSVAATVGSATVNVGSGTVSSVQSDHGAKDVAGTCKITGSVFGCNNLNGTPTGEAYVNVFKTTAKGTETAENPYYVYAVYGGGNKAAYDPEPSLGTSSTKATHVNIYTCANSIQYVYGGGNAASVPATNLTVWGGKFDWVFGGGNGKTEEGQPTNPGANVGYYTDTDINDVKSHGAEYGSGVANTAVHDGIINHLFGGSNTRGNIRKSSITELNDEGCDFTIGEVYAAGNEAYQNGTAEMHIGCIPGLGVIYGGARKADINNDVQLTITSGTYGQIFGGNNESGNINGSITVNIEETGCHPVVIGEVYGGGNLAPYTVPEGKAGPTINAYSFTKIGAIYGGGYGETAVVTGDTHVNVQELKGIHAGETDETYGAIPDAMGIIGNVYGGGNAAKVDGNTNVNIGTAKTVEFVSVDSDKTKTVLGANIQATEVTIPANITGGEAKTYTGNGNVFGGGNNAEVTGKTNVVIGADKQ